MMVNRVIVSTKVELQKELAMKTDEIVVQGDFSRAIAEIKKGQLSEVEQMGVSLGGAGTLSLLEYGITSLLSLFDASPKEDKKIQRQIQELYQIQKLTDDSCLLRLKQLDY